MILSALHNVPIKSQNPLTAKDAKILRKERRELKNNILTLRALRKPLRTLRLKNDCHLIQKFNRFGSEL
jgi:hypothetical protein